MITFKLSARTGLTYVIITLNVLVYVYTAILSGNLITIGDGPLGIYGQVNSQVMNGSYYQLFTSLFIHANIEHIAGNMFFLLIFGLEAEKLFNTKQYLLIYFLSGLAGNLLSLGLFLLFPGPPVIEVGASGAIFGVFGAVAIYIGKSIGGWRAIMAALASALFLLLLSAGPDVNSLAHVAGVVVGLLIGYVSANRRRPRMNYGFRYSYSGNAEHGW